MSMNDADIEREAKLLVDQLSSTVMPRAMLYTIATCALGDFARKVLAPVEPRELTRKAKRIVTRKLSRWVAHELPEVIRCARRNTDHCKLLYRDDVVGRWHWGCGAATDGLVLHDEHFIHHAQKELVDRLGLPLEATLMMRYGKLSSLGLAQEAERHEAEEADDERARDE